MARKDRVSFGERLEQSESKKPLLPILQSTENRPDTVPELIRRTYYLDETLIKALDLFAVYSRKDKSEIVREALKAYIPAKYQEMAKETNEEEDSL